MTAAGLPTFERGRRYLLKYKLPLQAEPWTVVLDYLGSSGISHRASNAREAPPIRAAVLTVLIGAGRVPRQPAHVRAVAGADAARVDQQPPARLKGLP
jgi:hypothetical protein